MCRVGECPAEGVVDSENRACGGGLPEEGGGCVRCAELVPAVPVLDEDVQPLVRAGCAWCCVLRGGAKCCRRWTSFAWTKWRLR